LIYFLAVGNLNAFIQIEDHFKSNKELSNNLFTTNSRPQCIKDAYLAASLTPLHIIRAIDSCRDDGRCGSKLFICQPVFADSKKKVNFDIETRRVCIPRFICLHVFKLMKNKIKYGLASKVKKFLVLTFIVIRTSRVRDSLSFQVCYLFV